MAKLAIDPDYFGYEFEGDSYEFHSDRIKKMGLAIQGFVERGMDDLPNKKKKVVPSYVAYIKRGVEKCLIDEKFMRYLYILVNDEYSLPLKNRDNLIIMVYKFLIAKEFITD